MLSNEEFEAAIAKQGKLDKLNPIHAIEEEPINGVISTPKGRIFMEVETIVLQEAMALAVEKLAAIASRDEKKAAYVDGKLFIIKGLLESSELMRTRAGIERAEREANKGLDNENDA
jgi:hypothetical protein